MADGNVSNYALMMDALRIYREAMRQFVVKRLEAEFGDLWWEQGVVRHFKVAELDMLERNLKARHPTDLVPSNADELADMIDVNHIRQIINANWAKVFRADLKNRAVLDGWVAEVTAARHTLAHWSGGDVDRPAALGFIHACRQVVVAVDEDAAAELERLWEQVDTEGGAPAAAPTSGLRAWRDVITPHRDVTSGNYIQAEFAVNLADVVGERAGDEYQQPGEFFRRTYLTGGIRTLLRSAVQRVAGGGGDPLFQLKTAFGGGKTHSLLALYHLFKHPEAALEHPDVAELVRDVGVDTIPETQVAVLVGTALDPVQPRQLSELGIELRTLWGEIAYQLGGVEGYRIVDDNDLRGRAPGSDTLAALFEQVGPSIILIDELVAFMRNIRGRGGRQLPSGSYDSNLTFIQNLTEAVRRTPTVQLVVSIPESAVELGPAGEQITREIEKIFGRMDVAWYPVTAEEAFEVVRRRLLGDLRDEAAARETCEAFGRMYREHHDEFPSETRERAYEERMFASYPIHPEVFDRLYNDWSTLDSFQRTRGVLRLLAAVLYHLWRSGDRSPLVMPGSFLLYEQPVRSELTRYLGEQWDAVVERDVDGPGSPPWMIDDEIERFGRLQAAKRLARTILLGSVPEKAQRGIDSVRVHLGAIQPGESGPAYRDALARMRQRSIHMYAPDERRYWYAVQPNLNRTVADRIGQQSDEDAEFELATRLRADRTRGLFAAVHRCPADSSEVPDEAAARLVVLPPAKPHDQSNGDSSPALDAAKEILNQRGDQQRQYRNMLVFLAPDATEVARLYEQAKQHLAWKSVHEDRVELNLDETQQRDARNNVESTDKSIEAILNAAYVWLLVPEEPDAAGAIQWLTVRVQPGRLDAVGSIVERAGNTLQSDELLLPKWSPTHLKRELDRWLWKDGEDHVSARELWEYFARYPYLSRLASRDVLAESIKDGVRSREYFGYAKAIQDGGKYEALTFGAPLSEVYFDGSDVVVRTEVAQAQASTVAAGEPAPGAETEKPEAPPDKPPAVAARRFYGTVKLDPARLASSAGTVGSEVVQHLEALLGAQVELTLEIQADVPDGVPDNVVRIVTENARTLKFDSAHFEEE